MTSDLIAVTGATGQLGSRVARRLAAAGVEQRLVVRDTSRAPVLRGAHAVAASYEDADALRGALDEVQTLLLVSATETADRVARHTTTVDAALDAGVSRIVYISFLGAAPDATFTFARDHWHTEQHIRESGIAFTFLRNSLYMDLVPSFAGEDGVIRGPAGQGRVAMVARDDIADVAAVVLREQGHGGATYDVTGPRALTLAEAAETISRVTGRTTRYHAETMEEAYASRARYGAPEWEVAGWVTSYAAIAAGELDVVSDTVEKIVGHPPMSFAEYLRTTSAL
ncbi:SDR family oxidoreductase [Microtetraspora sp. AC03309]|uniref:SDR family oxidoreductase n=1 Tax=Microtetraspora sp. AC03309 TaxID=2779376 RepID=UPI001E450E35|nr:SDR family oxidoreductase [Microtetraspora sp. AC03309]MCC5575575.1 SDR family oxidoreductase [Microtetraspora sp. AC03309]